MLILSNWDIVLEVFGDLIKNRLLFYKIPLPLVRYELAFETMGESFLNDN